MVETSLPDLADRRASAWPGHALSLGIIAASVLLADAAQRWIGLAEPALIILLGVLVTAARSATLPALAAALLGFLAYNVVFIEPRFSLHIGSRDGWVAGAAFLASALVAGRLASRLSMQVRALDSAKRRAEARQKLAHTLLEADSVEAVHKAATQAFAAELDVVVEWPDSSSDSGEEAGLLGLPGTSSTPGGLRLLDRRGHPARLSDAQAELARHFALDAAQALVRLRLSEELGNQRLANETERLRSALLASVSHDLRSPLSGIIGAAGTLENYAEHMDESDRRSLLETIREEGERLDRYIQNLLDMTRLGHQSLPLQRDWIGVDELVGAVVGRARRYWPASRLEVRIAPQMPPIRVHAALIEQALFNIVENALSFSPPDAAVRIIAVQPDPDSLQIDVIDRGPGIPDAERERIFDLFYSVERGDRGRKGTGLGLSICRGMIGAYGGQVSVGSDLDGSGSRLRIHLPLQAASP